MMQANTTRRTGSATSVAVRIAARGDGFFEAALPLLAGLTLSVALIAHGRLVEALAAIAQ